GSPSVSASTSTPIARDDALHHEIVEPLADDEARRVPCAVPAVVEAGDHPLDDPLRVLLSLRVEADAVLADDDDDVARQDGHGGAAVGEDRLAHPLHRLWEHVAGLDALPRVIDGPRGDRADHLLPMLLRVPLHVEEALHLAHHLLVRLFVLARDAVPDALL